MGPRFVRLAAVFYGLLVVAAAVWCGLSGMDLPVLGARPVTGLLLGLATAAGSVSGRPDTVATVTWTPPSWPTVGARGAEQKTPNLAPVVQEIVSRAGWASGNSLVLVVTGTGTRTAESYEGGVDRAPVLHIEYRTS